MKRVLALIILLVFSRPCLSQHKPINAYTSLAEKIYLQLDGKVYTTGNTVWFKVIVTNAVDHEFSLISKVLYVELVDSDKNILERRVIKLENGLATGAIELQTEYDEGIYMVRAYTQWNKNFDNDFISTEYIQIFAPSGEDISDPIGKVTVIENESDHNNLLRANLNPYLIDSLHNKALILYVRNETIFDSISVKPDKQNRYLFEYALPKHVNTVTLQMKTKHKKGRPKNLVIDRDYLHVQFFPESGELVQGINSIIGFKAVNYEGKGIYVEGEIVNEEGDIVSWFKSNSLGMGSFILLAPDTTFSYFGRIVFPDKNVKKFPLPKVIAKGNILHVRKVGEKVWLHASSSYMDNDSTYLRISNRGHAFYEQMNRLKNGQLLLQLKQEDLPEGIISFCLMNHKKETIAERLYFNERPENRLIADLCLDRKVYKQREPVKLQIQTSDQEGNLIPASISVKVINKAQMGEMHKLNQNVLSFFLLSSDLKGEIESPGFYFENGKAKHADLDALLLTQGLSQYKYNRPIGEIDYQPEASLSISGTVKGLFNKKKDNASLTMMTFGQYPQIESQTTDSLGRFRFYINPEYGRRLPVMLQTANKFGANKNFIIEFDKPEPPPVLFKPINVYEKSDEVVKELVTKNIERSNVANAFRLTTESLMLEEVVIEEYRMTPEREKMMEKYGKPSRVISGKAIQEKEKKWSFGLYSVIMFNFPEIRIKRIDSSSYSFLYAQVRNTIPSLVVVDGEPVRLVDYSLIPNIPPGEVASFEIIENAKGFFHLYQEVFGPSQDTPSVGDVISIYTHSGNGIFSAQSPVGIVQTEIELFAPPVEYDVTSHHALNPEDWVKPDLRALVHWEPMVFDVDPHKPFVEFYNADNVGDMVIVIEGISSTGKIVYEEVGYKVEKREK